MLYPSTLYQSIPGYIKGTKQKLSIAWNLLDSYKDSCSDIKKVNFKGVLMKQRSYQNTLLMSCKKVKRYLQNINLSEFSLSLSLRHSRQDYYKCSGPIVLSTYHCETYYDQFDSLN